MKIPIKKVIRTNYFNVGKSPYFINGYTKHGREGSGIELHVSSFGSIYLLPDDKKKEGKTNYQA